MGSLVSTRPKLVPRVLSQPYPSFDLVIHQHDNFVDCVFSTRYGGTGWRVLENGIVYTPQVKQWRVSTLGVVEFLVSLNVDEASTGRNTANTPLKR